MHGESPVFPGARVTLDDPRYPTLVRGFNERWVSHTRWTETAQEGVNLNWINGFYCEMYGDRGPWPDATFDGCYVNYCDSDLRDWQHLYYKDNYPRLRRVKKQWDPHNIFHHGQSIELP
jgi:berberine-like enzyme